MSSKSRDWAVRAQYLGKCYQLGELRTLLGRRSKAVAPLEHWALDDVSFDIAHGEAVGIIGHNGAGKSTLLKILARITEPSRGQATIYGRVASLLEVGTGFHPELTGRENIFMNGSILGMRRAEIATHFNEIVDFAGVEKFIDTPVKRYSSGMQLRLAFSVAAHLQPEILIVDEVLAVGDVQFQKKCMGKMGDVARAGRTVLFVSHNMAAVRQLTSRCIVLSGGKVAFDGNPGRAIEVHAEAMSSAFTQGADLASWPRGTADQDRLARFHSLGFEGGQAVFEAGGTVAFWAQLIARQPLRDVRISGTIFHSEGYPVGSFFSPSTISLEPDEPQRYLLRLEDTRLAPGRYCFGLACGLGNETEGHRDFDIVMEVLPFEVAALSGSDEMMGAWPSNWGAIRVATPALTLQVAHD